MKRSSAFYLFVLLLILGLFPIEGIVFKSIHFLLIMCTISFLVFIISGEVYVALFFPYTSTAKWLKSKGMENVADDILLEAPTFPKSKIYCGKNALFDKKECKIIPYSEIAWIYMRENRINGIPVGKDAILYAKDGKRFSLPIDVDEVKWLLVNYIVINSPTVVIGYGQKQKQRYKQLNPGAGKRAMRKAGILLISMGVICLIPLIISITEIPPIVYLIPYASASTTFLIIGAIIFAMGKKQ